MHHNAARQTPSRGLVWVRAFHSRDQQLSRGPEHVVVRNFAPLLRLDPLRAQTMMPAPLLEDRPQPDDMQEGLLTRHPSDLRAVVVVEVPVDRNAAGFGKGDRFLDLAPLEVPLVWRLVHMSEIRVLSQG